MPLTIKPPRPPSSEPPPPASTSSSSSSASQAPQRPSIDTAIPNGSAQPQQQQRSSSPVAPECSPITPKVQPALPATIIAPPYDGRPDTYPFANPSVPPPVPAVPSPAPVQNTPVAPPPAEYIPQPPNLPFSSEDATDAIALRATISILQIQKNKARNDIRALEDIKKLALEDPLKFKSELLAGRLNEQRRKFGSLQELLDAPSSEDEDDNEDEEEVTLGAQEMDHDAAKEPEIPDSQPASFSAQQPSRAPKAPKETPYFPPVPGPQNVIRMPPINWEKYHIVGGPLDAMHEQQRKWPGSAPNEINRGRESTIAAPYSPWLDGPELQARHARQASDGSRKDSFAPSTATATPVTAGPADHSYETITRRTSSTRARRRSSKNS